jgi:Ca2+-binding RTX toxin-like protein
MTIWSATAWPTASRAGNDTLDGGGGDRTLFGKADGSKPDRSAKPGTDGDELFGGEGND